MPCDSIPAIGFGTSKATGGECTKAVEYALEIGYRHIDTAQMYDNQDAVGKGIHRSGVDRDDILLATKIHFENLGYDEVFEHAERCKQQLGVDHIDLLYVHWPMDTYDPSETLPAFNELYDSGDIGHIGVSNFTPEMLESAIEQLDAPICAHQVECHPLCQQEELRSLASEYGHALVAYCPLIQGRAGEIELLQTIAEEYDATPAQISLAWLMAKDHVVPIPKSVTHSYIAENLRSKSIDLAAEDAKRIDQIGRDERQVDFPEAPWNT